VNVVAACVLYAYGLGIPLISNPFGESIATGVFDLPLTILWVLIVVNAINLIDGTEYIAAGAVATDDEVWYLPALLEGMGEKTQ